MYRRLLASILITFVTGPPSPAFPVHAASADPQSPATNAGVPSLGFAIPVANAVLATHGAMMVSMYVTYAVFPKRSWQRFVHTIGDFCALAIKDNAIIAPFEVLTLAGSYEDTSTLVY